MLDVNGTAKLGALTGTTATFSGYIYANGGIALGDNDKILLGQTSDLQIYHDGSNSYIKDAGTGELKLVGSSYVKIEDTSGEKGLEFRQNEGVKLFYNNNQKFATASTGVSVTGQLDLSSHLDMPDNAWIKLGASDDLLITHDGSSSWIIDNGAGGLVLASDSLYIKNAAYNETGLSFIENGAVTLFYDNVAKIATTSSGINVTGGLLSATSSNIQLNNGYALKWESSGATKITGGAASAYLAFDVNSGERMRILSDGNVGIGITNPSSEFYVNGRTQLDGDLDFCNYG